MGASPHSGQGAPLGGGEEDILGFLAGLHGHLGWALGSRAPKSLGGNRMIISTLRYKCITSTVFLCVRILCSQKLAELNMLKYLEQEQPSGKAVSGCVMILPRPEWTPLWDGGGECVPSGVQQRAEWRQGEASSPVSFSSSLGQHGLLHSGMCNWISPSRPESSSHGLC